MKLKDFTQPFRTILFLSLPIFFIGCNLVKPSEHSTAEKVIYYGDTAKFVVENLYKKRLFIYQGDTLPYREFNYSSLWEKPLPMVIFLHGSGERGNDNFSQLSHGSEWIWRASMSGYPCHAIFPQCPKNSYWSNVQRTVDSSGKPHFEFNDDTASTKAMKLLMSFVEHLKKQSYIDINRIYIGGLSMGGMGTIELVKRMPNTFAAAFPICGGGKISHFKPLRTTQWWFFHGLKDDIVPPSNSINLVQQLRSRKINVQLTLYPYANHNSWDSAFAEPGLLPWLFKQHLNKS